MATLLDVRALTRHDWPASPDQVRDLAWSHFAGRPDLQESLAFGPGGHDVGWFVFYGSADSALDEYKDFCAALSADIGAPIDMASTSAAWRTGKFVIEAYVHPQSEHDPHSSHQLGISFFSD